MFSNCIYSVGLAGPLLLLFIGFLVIGLLFSGAAIVVRLRADTELNAEKSQRKIDWAIAILAISGVLPILGGVLSHYGFPGRGMILAIVGTLLLWPTSVVLTVWGRGAGRNILLVGHALIPLLAAVLIFIVSIQVC
jgi:hypothetical protein